MSDMQALSSSHQHHGEQDPVSGKGGERSSPRAHGRAAALLAGMAALAQLGTSAMAADASTPLDMETPQSTLPAPEPSHVPASSSVQPQSSRTLPAVTVSSPRATSVERPTATGSYLQATPLETPASMDVFTREQMDSRGDSSLTESITRTTGVTAMPHPGNSGVGFAARGFSGSTSIMQLYDGMRQYGHVDSSFPFQTWSVDHVEVLRGPASILHGDSGIGAVVNVVPKKPVQGPIRNEIQATVGTKGKRGLDFGSGGALGERLSYRVDASTDRSDGWVDRGRNSNRALSGALRYDVTPELNLNLSHAQGWRKPINYYGIPLIDGQAWESLRKKNYDALDGRIAFRDRWTQLGAEWTPSADLRVRSRLYHIASARYWHSVDNFEWNADTGLIDRNRATEILQRQRQTGNTTDVMIRHALAGMSNQVALGFDISRSTFRHSNNGYEGSAPSADPYDFDPGFFSSPNPFIPRRRNQAEQAALFAEDRLVLNSQWSVMAGLRRDWLDIDREDLVTGARDIDRSYANTGWRIGTVYQWDPNSSVYAQVARAAEPVSSLFFLSPDNANFGMTTGRQVEVGFKKLLPGQRGEFTLALYDIEKKNLLTRDPDDPSRSIPVGKRSARGVEATASLNLSSTLRLDANATVLRARYDDFSERDAGVVVSRNGNVPTDVPERAANLWLDWKLLPDWTLGGGARHVGKRYADDANTMEMPAYTTMDFALRWQATSDTTVALRGFNVTDRLYYASHYYNNTQWLVGEGRRFELSVHYRF